MKEISSFFLSVAVYACNDGRRRPLPVFHDFYSVFVPSLLFSLAIKCLQKKKRKKKEKRKEKKKKKKPTEHDVHITLFELIHAN